LNRTVDASKTIKKHQNTNRQAYAYDITIATKRIQELSNDLMLSALETDFTNKYCQGLIDKVQERLK
jgi:hypothetical protein